MKLAFLFLSSLLYLLAGCVAHAQEKNNELIPILKKLVNHKTCKQSLFQLSLDGEKSTVIVIDTNLSRMIPDLNYQLSTNDFLVKIIDEKDANVYVVSELMTNDHVKYFIVFDRMEIRETTATLQLHTSSLIGKPTYRYVRVNANFVKKGTEWEAERVVMTDSTCCDKIWGDIETEMISPDEKGKH